MSKFKIGDYVMAKDRKGTVRYCGPVHFKEAHQIFVGIELDDPVGKNDGEVQGKRYFECQPNHGLMVPLEQVALVPKVLNRPPNTPVRQNRASALRLEAGSVAGSDVTSFSMMSRASALPAVRETQKTNRTAYNQDLEKKFKEVTSHLIAEQDKNLELESKITELESKIEELVSQCENDKTTEGNNEFEKAELEVKLAVIMDENAELKTNLDAAKALIAKDKELYDTRGMELANLQETLKQQANVTTNSKELIIAELQSSLASARTDLGKVETKYAETQKILEASTAENAAFKESKNSLDAELASTSKRLVEANSQIQQLMTEIEVCKKSKDDELKALSASLDDKEAAAVTELQSSLAAARSDVAQWETKYAEIQKLLDSATSENAVVNESKSSLDTELATTSKQLTEANSQIQQLMTEIEVLKKSKDDELKAILASQGDKEATVVTELQSSLAAARTNLEQLETKYVETQKLLDSATTENRAVEESKNSLDAELATTSKQLVEANSQIQQLMTEIDAFKKSKDDELKALSASLGNKEASAIAEIQAALASAHTDLEQLKTKYAETQNLLEVAMTENSAFKDAKISSDAELVTTSKQLTEANSQIQRLMADFEAYKKSKDDELKTMSATFRYKEVSTAMAEYQAALASARTDLWLYESRCTETQRRLECAIADASAVRDTNDCLDVVLVNTSKQLVDSNARIKQLMTELEVCKKSKDDELKALSASLNDKDAAAVTELQAVQDALASARSDVVQWETKYAEIQKLLDSATSENAVVNESKSSLDTELATTSKQLTEANSQIQQLMTEIEVLKKSKDDELKAILASQGDKEATVVTELQSSLAAARTNLEQLETKYVETQKLLDSATTEHRAVEESKNSLDAELATTSKQLVEANSQIQQLMTEIDAFKKSKDDELKALSASCGDKEVTAIAELQASLSAAHSDLANLESKYAEAQRALENLRSDNGPVSALTEKCKMLEKRLAETETVVQKENLNTSKFTAGEADPFENIALLEKLTSLEKRNKTLEAKVADMNDTIRTFTKASAEGESSIPFLNGIIVDLKRKIDYLNGLVIEVPPTAPLPTKPVDSLSKQMDNLSIAKKPANRDYCDICEEFTHDTRACPKYVEPVTKPQVMPSQREFCDDCDMFTDGPCTIHNAY